MFVGAMKIHHEVELRINQVTMTITRMSHRFVHIRMHYTQLQRYVCQKANNN